MRGTARYSAKLQDIVQPLSVGMLLGELMSGFALPVSILALAVLLLAWSTWSLRHFGSLPASGQSRASS